MFKKMYLWIWAIGLCFNLLACEAKTEAFAVLKRSERVSIPDWASDSLLACMRFYPENTELAIAILQNGNPSYFGLKRLGDTVYVIENHKHVFEIGSITKVLTAHLLAHEVINGELTLSDSINRYFDFPFHQNTAIQVVSLANHSSGLPRLPSNFWLSALLHPSNPYKTYDHNKLDDYLKNSLTLDQPSGTKSAYSNLGMGLLAYTLSIKNQLSYEQMLQQRLVQQYGLRYTTSDKKKIDSLLVKGLNQKGQVTSNWDPGALVGCGGVYSNVADLSLFAIANFNDTNRVLNLCRTKTMEAGEKRSVALGWFILHKPKHDWFWHNGGTGGYSSSMVLNPKTKNAVIILSNVSAYHKHANQIDKAGFMLMQVLDTTTPQ